VSVCPYNVDNKLVKPFDLDGGLMFIIIKVNHKPVNNNALNRVQNFEYLYLETFGCQQEV
jgi:hypothetical protein